MPRKNRLHHHGFRCRYKHEILFNDGMIVQKNFHAYNLPRINDAPGIEVHIMENNAMQAGSENQVCRPSLLPLPTLYIA